MSLLLLVLMKVGMLTAVVLTATLLIGIAFDISPHNAIFNWILKISVIIVAITLVGGMCIELFGGV